MEVIGWLGSLAFSLCAVPQAWTAWEEGTCDLNPVFLWLWGIGEALTLAYAASIGAAPLIVNYVLNGASLAVIVYFNRREAPRDR